MFPKQKRLSKKEFGRFFSSGKKYHTQTLSLTYSPEEVFKSAVVVSKKTERKAIKRNKLRRQIYAILRAHQKETGCVGVFIFFIKSPFKEKTTQEQKEEIYSIIKKATK